MDLQNLTTFTVYNATNTNDNGSLKPTVWQAIMTSVYCIIILLGCTGNLLVVYVVLKKKTMQTITNIFITNLAISDIMMCLLVLPFTPLAALLKSWVFGEAMCRIVPLTLGVSVYVSNFTMTAIAIDMYFVIIYPFKKRMSVLMCILLIVFIWVLSVAISLPHAIYQRVTWLMHNDNAVCHEQWPRETARRVFTMTSLILQYLVPCIISIFCCTNVFMKLRIRTPTTIDTINREEIEITQKRRTNMMLIAMVTIFVICWLPLKIVHFTIEYTEVFNGRYLLVRYFMSVVHLIAMSSIIYNPFLYALMDENFKKAFKEVIPCLFRRGDGHLNGNTSQYTMVNQSPPNDRNGCSNETKDLFDKEREV